MTIEINSMFVSYVRFIIDGMSEPYEVGEMEPEDAGLVNPDLQYTAVAFPEPKVLLCTKSLDAGKPIHAVLDVPCAPWDLFTPNPSGPPPKALMNEQARKTIESFVQRIIDLRIGGAVMHPIASSNIDSAGYDEGNQYLFVAFKGGGNYMYYDVPPWTLGAMVRSDSPGRFLNEQIKPRYRYDKLP